VHHLFPSITATPGAYSIVGMGAVVSGTTHGPMTAILILFEMTDNYTIILPLMICCIMGSMVSRQILSESIYTLKLVRRGVDLKAGKEVNVLRSIPVKDVMNPDVETVPEGLPLERIKDKVSKSKFNSFPVLNGSDEIVGILSFNDYSEAIFDENLRDLVVAKDLATTQVVTVFLDDNLYTALEKISREDFSLLPVVAADNPQHLMGIITRRDIIGAYNRAVLKKTLFRKEA
jgi:CIC family chloride channel protein